MSPKTAYLAGWKEYLAEHTSLESQAQLALGRARMHLWGYLTANFIPAEHKKVVRSVAEAWFQEGRCFFWPQNEEEAVGMRCMAERGVLVESCVIHVDDARVWKGARADATEALKRWLWAEYLVDESFCDDTDDIIYYGEAIKCGLLKTSYNYELAAKLHEPPDA